MYQYVVTISTKDFRFTFISNFILFTDLIHKRKVDIKSLQLETTDNNYFLGTQKKFLWLCPNCLIRYSVCPRLFLRVSYYPTRCWIIKRLALQIVCPYFWFEMFKHLNQMKKITNLKITNASISSTTNIKLITKHSIFTSYSITCS